MAANSWLYTANEPTKLAIVCGAKRHEMALTDVGVINT